ncbi:protein mis12 [Anaeramoeba flamelloides]|uniref:Protein mis12 n=1 Tax=Anaeramoeba flamelloides TaxID=1746091 RepID=A0ABQ8ZDG6_9EUKA|nr:protein mis12 [Anaeramoeba flamelloides]
MTSTESFFNWKPEEFVDDIANATSDFLCDGVDAIENCLISDIGLNNKEAKKGCDSFLTHMQTIVDKNFDRFELYINRNIFALPSNFEKIVDFDQNEDKKSNKNKINKKKKSSKLKEKNSSTYKNIESSADELEYSTNSEEANSMILQLDKDIQELQEEIKIQTNKNKNFLRKKRQLVNGIENYQKSFQKNMNNLQNVQSSFNLNSVTELINEISSNCNQLQELDQSVNKMKINDRNFSKNNTNNYHTKFLQNRSTTNNVSINQLTHFNKKMNKK